MKVCVDADSCAVKEEVVRVAECHDLAIVFVSDQLRRWPRSHLIVCVLVSDGVEVAEDWIVERIGADNNYVTQDIQLAKCCLDTGAQAIGATGKPFDEANSGMALAMRKVRQHLRETGQRGSYNAPLRRED